jgi:hypothetical protein
MQLGSLLPPGHTSRSSMELIAGQDDGPDELGLAKGVL